MATRSSFPWPSTSFISSNSQFPYQLSVKSENIVSMRQSIIMNNNNNNNIPINEHEISPKRKTGRPPTYVFTKPDSELSENELRLKSSVLKRRQRQNRSYHRKKMLKQEQEQQRIVGQASSSFELAPFVPDWATSSLTPSPPHMQQQQQQQQQPQPDNSFDTSPVFTSILSDLCTSIPSNSQITELIPTTSSYPTSLSQPQPSSRTTLQMNYNSPTILPTISTQSSYNMSPNKLTHNSSMSSHIEQPQLHNNISNQVPSQHDIKSSIFTTEDLLKQITEMSSAGTNFSSSDEEKLLNRILEPATETITGSENEKGNFIAQPPIMSRDNLIQLTSLPVPISELLHHCSLFVDSFTPEAIITVAGLPNQSTEHFLSTTFNQLEQSNLAKKLPSNRLQLTDVGKALISTNAVFDTEVAKKRFVTYFSSRLREFHPNNLNTNGSERFRAIEYCDDEYGNMKAAVDFSLNWEDSTHLINFLYNGAAVLRYSISGHDRIKWFTHGMQRLCQATQTCEPSRLIETRFRVALAEAYMDILAYQDAQTHLDESIRRMNEDKQNGSVCRMCSVISPLLLAQLHTRSQSYEIAQKLLRQVLGHLQNSGMQYTTFAISCLLNLATVYTATHLFEKALQMMHAAMDVLNRLGFTHLPIYADALQTIGTLHMEQGNSQQAQKLFSAAFDVIEKWKTSKKWKNVPIQHCMHLDIFLIECIAKTMFIQNRRDEGRELLSNARQRRTNRDLKEIPTCIEEMSMIGSTDQNLITILKRHLY